LIATLEQDDVWHSEKLALIRKAFEAFPEAGLVYGDYQAFEKEPPVLNEAKEARAQLLSPDGAIKLAMEKQFTLSLSNMVFCKSWWKRVGSLPERFKICADYNFLARLLRAGCPVAHVPKALVYYRVRPESVWFGSDYVKRNFERYAAVDYLCRAYPSLVDQRLRKEVGDKIFDIAYKSAVEGRCFQAISFYIWSLRYGAPPGRVFRSIARVLLKLFLSKDYE
jgi:GT2 family glycosyltransferase